MFSTGKGKSQIVERESFLLTLDVKQGRSGPTSYCFTDFGSSRDAASRVEHTRVFPPDHTLHTYSFNISVD